MRSGFFQGSLLIVWNSVEAKQVKVYRNPHPTGVCSVNFTPDGERLATLSALIPEEFILGKIPSHRTTERVDGPESQIDDGSRCAGVNTEKGGNPLSELYQGVAIWNWKDAGWVPLFPFPYVLTTNFGCRQYRVPTRGLAGCQKCHAGTRR